MDFIEIARMVGIVFSVIMLVLTGVLFITQKITVKFFLSLAISVFVGAIVFGFMKEITIFLNELFPDIQTVSKDLILMGGYMYLLILYFFIFKSLKK